jgi:hypothetical protein
MRHVLMAATVAVVLAFGAQAAANGKVTAVTGQAGEVMIQRDGKTFTLASGAQLQDGDLVFTNTNGGAELTFSGCSKTLGGAQSIIVGPNVCRAAVSTISAGQVVGGVKIGTAAGVGAGSVIAGVLGAAGVIGAVSGGASSSSP